MGLTIEEHLRLMYFYGPLFVLHILLLVICGLFGGSCILVWLEDVDRKTHKPLQSIATDKIREPDDMYLHV